MGWFKNLFKKIFNKKAPVATIPPVIVIPPVIISEPIKEIPSTDKTLEALNLNPSSIAELNATCATIKSTKNRYLYVQEKTGVPWDVIAACHYRESSLSFKGVLHNGEYIIGKNKKTKLVPAGRGPFETWEEAGVDAMLIEKNKFPLVWNTAGKFDFCEKYNGLGYRKKGIPSPYVYAGTNKYSSGLYVADGKFSASKVDRRLGCAAIIKGLSV